ncbi:DNA repair metallo-beta-lactamase [Arabidopsis thaliana x Arabidopsis arenosa]|uniref:DNA repair metallo-beta-lactamase n=1 Tax=Arabidopsis thaliana x Arabidopsis arenosa TaxID=1240361 RepID=A0A8T2AAH8_9BRAS|nr:DNA repair metallo-beta-lactamase [Arabidopsis thaliana x Arabidopsis arenosa]
MSNTVEDDDDDFQIPPSSQLSIRKPLQPTNANNISHRRPPNKKPRLSRNPGKENVTPPPSPDADLFCSSSTPHCSLDCVPSSVDCSIGPISSLGEDDQVLIDKEDKDDCIKVNREGYLCNSVEARLLKSTIRLGFDSGIHEDDEGFVESNSELDVLIKLCSESEGRSGECSLGNDDSIQCPLCSMDISALSEEQRQVHSNTCLDKSYNQPPEQDSLRKCENSSSLIEESIDDPVQLPQLITDLSPVLIWLRSLGLAKYEDVFIREEIDWDTLKSLTEEDLLSIGITSLGPRKKIVNALSGLREPFASSAEAQAQSHCTSSHVTERQRDTSTTRKASEPKKLTANKLITEFFPGQATEGTKIRKAPKEPVAEKSPSDSSSRRAVRRNSNNGKSKVIPHWNCIPGTPFRVDAFKYLTRDCCHWFLTHFHLDHYQGLTKSFSHGKIYCSLVTAKLVNMKIGIPWERLQVLDIGQKVNIGGIDVTCFNANHCPGSIMILFEPANGKAVLHTGDFRYCEEMSNWLTGSHISSLILDTTYCNPQYDFPKQEAVIQFVVEAIQAEAFNPKTLFLIGSYTIGKERLFLEVARVLREKIYINPSKLKLLECLGFSKEDMQWFTVKEEESHIHVVPLWTLASFKRLKHISNRYTNRYSLIVAFSPTGWTSGKTKKKSPGRRLQQGTIIRYEVPYSEHSSFTELKEFVQKVSPEVIIPSVNNDGPDSAAAMVSMLVT